MATGQERVVKITVQAGTSEVALKQFSRELAKAETSLNKFQKNAANDSQGGFAKISRNAGQASIQLQQFAGQIQGGQSAMLAFSQQAADVGIVLGAPLIGAFLGITASIAGAFVPALFKANAGIDELKSSTDSLKDSFSELDKAAQALVIDSLTRQANQLAREEGQLAAELFDVTKELEDQWLATKLLTDNEEELTIAAAALSAQIAEKQLAYKNAREEIGRLTDTQKNLQTEFAASGIIQALGQQLTLFNATEREISLYTATLKGASAAELETIAVLEDAVALQKEKFKFNELANIGQTQGDPAAMAAIIEQEKNNAILLENQQAFVDQIKAINATQFSTMEEQRSLEFQKNIAAYNNELISLEQFHAQQLSIIQQFGDAKTNLTKQQQNAETDAMASNAKNALGMLSVFGTNSFKIQKGFAIADAIVNITAGVAKALNNPYPANLGFAAQVAAQGAALITTIKSTDPNSTSTATTPTATTSASTSTFAPQTTRETQTESTQINALLNELQDWNGSTLIPVEYARRIAESLAQVQRTGGV